MAGGVKVAVSSDSAASYSSVDEVISGIGRAVGLDSWEARQLQDDLSARLFGKAPQSGADQGLIDGRYRIEALIGEGGMGAVYRALDTVEGRRVALKRLRARRSANPLRFRREFHTLAGLQHPRIVDVYQFGSDASGPYYTMELLAGTDLAERAPLQLRECCLLLRDVASALAFLHARQLIHRDVTPRNVRVTADGSAKLVDFGLLATSGVVGEVAGTPAFIAPESRRGSPLDHRADLFGLGALAYWLLTGRYAFAAQSLDDLTEAWRERPAPPSQLRAHIPEVVDRLVMSLLSQDPLARPASAAEVIDRLQGIAQLQPVPEIETARGYVASAALVGRSAELVRLRELLDGAVDGRGGAALIQSPAGVGRTRLLRELGLHGQLAGASVYYVEGGAGRGPYGLLQQIARVLAKDGSSGAIAAAQPHADCLRHILPVLFAQRPQQRAISRPLAGEPTEERLRVQTALVSWLLEVSRQRPLLLLLDDLQSADEASVAALALLSQSVQTAPFLLVGALRTDEALRAPQTIARMREHNEVLDLTGLDRLATAALVRGMFGDVPNAAKLADVMYEATGGSPLHCAELARYLVDQQALRYADGMWVVPDDIQERQLPRQLAEAMDLRIVEFGAGARRLGQALAVLGDRFSLSLCSAVVDDSAEAVLTALDELVSAGALIGDTQRLRFLHSGMRDALLRSLDTAARKALHRRCATVLSAGGRVAPDREAEVGRHWLEAGEPLQAAPLLERAGQRFFAALAALDAIGPLTAALEIYKRQGIRPQARLAIRRQLMLAGTMASRETMLRHGVPSIDEAWHYSGLGLAERLAPRIGRWLAFAIGFGWAGLRWLCCRRRFPSPREALASSLVISLSVANALSLMLAVEPLRRLLERMEVLRIFRGRMPAGAYSLVQALLGVPEGRRQIVHEACEAGLEVLRRDNRTPVSKLERRLARTALLMPRAWTALLDQDPALEGHLQRVEQTGLRSHAYGCQLIRSLYHRARGEEGRANAIRAEADRLGSQYVVQWQLEDAAWWQSSLSYALTRDVLGLRRCIGEMQRLQAHGYQLADLIDLALGEYHRECGALDKSLELLLALYLRTDQTSFVRQQALAALAETRLAAGQVIPCLAAAIEGQALGMDPDRGLKTVRVRCERVLALAAATMGDFAEAQQRLGAALQQAEPLASPTVIGAIHEAWAAIAHAAGDRQTYARQRDLTSQWFSPTANPALISRAELVAALGNGPDAAHQQPTSGAAPPHQIGSVLVTQLPESRLTPL